MHVLQGLDISSNADVLQDLAGAFSNNGKEQVPYVSLSHHSWAVSHAPLCPYIRLPSHCLHQVTERILRRVMSATGDVHIQLCFAESLARQRKLEEAAVQFKEVRMLWVRDFLCRCYQPTMPGRLRGRFILLTTGTPAR